jgi:soluble lytic murein transglycosylase-like protein
MSCKLNLSPLVQDEARRQGVDPAIALAVANRESGVCHWWANGQVKIGSSGEIGVMQVMPDTAPGANLYDYQQNIRAGVAFLGQMYRQFGSWAMAAAAYNWGPGKLRAAIAGNRAIPSSVIAYARAVTGETIGQTQGTYAASSSTTNYGSMPIQASLSASEPSKITPIALGFLGLTAIVAAVWS